MPSQSNEILFSQTFFNARHPPITLMHIPECRLDSSHVDWLLQSVTSEEHSVPSEAEPIVLGMQIAISQSARLSAIAISTRTKVLIITEIIKPRSPDDDPRDSNSALHSGREYLQSTVLGSGRYRITAFDAHHLVLALHKSMNLACVYAIDLLSLPPRSRDILKTVEMALWPNAKFLGTHLAFAFRDMVFKSGPDGLVNLAQKAWLAFIVGSHPTAFDEITKLVPIDTSSFHKEELDLLSQSLEGLNVLDVSKESSKTYKPSSAAIVGDKVCFSIDKFKDRLRVSSDQELRVQGSAVMQSSLVSARGGAVELQVPDFKKLGNSEIKEITLDGKDGPTMAEKQHAQIVLLILQKKIPLVDNKWLQILYPATAQPSDPEIPTENQELSDQDSCPPIPGSSVSKLLPVVFHRELNESQQGAVESMLDISQPVTLIQGPPGTGKTTVIAAYISSILRKSGLTVWVIAQSNVAVKNIAEKLYESGIPEWVLFVSDDFYTGWHEHQYQDLPSSQIFTSATFKTEFKKLRTRVILCTVSMLSNPKVFGLARKLPMTSLVVDEASQIPMSTYMPIIARYGKDIIKMSLIGDDKQLPPFGSDSSDSLDSIFENSDLTSKLNVILLNIQYRMPPPLGQFLSVAMYSSELHSWDKHPVQDPACCQFIDIPGCSEEPEENSFKNSKEAAVVVSLAAFLLEQGKNIKIITPYDAQRNFLEAKLKANELAWKNTCFTVDSFQGNECDYIILSVVRTRSLGFLLDQRRSNVMLSRAKKGMFICSKRGFLEGTDAKVTLLGKMAKEWSSIDKGWIAWDDQTFEDKLHLH